MPLQIQCPVCNGLFVPVAINRRYCSVKCRNSNYRKREKALREIDKAESAVVYHPATQLVLDTWSRLALAGQLPSPMLFVDCLACQSFAPPPGLLWERGSGEPSHWVMWA